jgi:hypothetical protein
MEREHLVEREFSIIPGKAQFCSFTFPEAGALRVTAESVTGQEFYIMILNGQDFERFEKKNLEQLKKDQEFEPAETGVITERDRIQLYINSGDWYVVVMCDHDDTEVATVRLEVEYAH